MIYIRIYKVKKKERPVTQKKKKYTQKQFMDKES